MSPYLAALMALERAHWAHLQEPNASTEFSAVVAWVEFLFAARAANGPEKLAADFASYRAWMEFSRAAVAAQQER